MPIFILQTPTCSAKVVRGDGTDLSADTPVAPVNRLTGSIRPIYDKVLIEKQCCSHARLC